MAEEGHRRHHGAEAHGGVCLVYRSAGVSRRLSCVYTAILEWLEYGLYKEYIRVLSKIIFYLLQDGGMYV